MLLCSSHTGDGQQHLPAGAEGGDSDLDEVGFVQRRERRHVQLVLLEQIYNTKHQFQLY